MPIAPHAPWPHSCWDGNWLDLVWVLCRKLCCCEFLRSEAMPYPEDSVPRRCSSFSCLHSVFFPSSWASVVWWWRAWHRSTIQAWPLSSHLFPGLWPRESLHRPQPATNRRFSCYSREQCWCGQFGIITRVVFNLKVKRCLSPFHYIVGISLTGRVPVSSVWQTLRFFPWELLICHSSRV